MHPIEHTRPLEPGLLRVDKGDSTEPEKMWFSVDGSRALLKIVHRYDLYDRIPFDRFGCYLCAILAIYLEEQPNGCVSEMTADIIEKWEG